MDYNRTGNARHCDPSRWFNPRRQRQAERLIAFLLFNGIKVYLGSRTYTAIRTFWATRGMDRAGVDQAVDDLYSLGLAEITVNPDSDVDVVVLLGDDIDGALRRLAALHPQPVRVQTQTARVANGSTRPHFKPPAQRRHRGGGVS